MGRSKVNYDEDKSLAVEVKTFLCLYDKNCPSYKDKQAKANAWSEVDKSLGLEEGKFILVLQSNLVNPPSSQNLRH